MTGYYDYVLGLIPLALVGITALLFVAGIDLTKAVPVGATASVLVIGHAMFVNGPVDAPSTREETPNATPNAPPVNAD
ncbi:MAG: hypothetical protein ABEJ82_07510 [Haloplanus sp.]